MRSLFTVILGFVLLFAISIVTNYNLEKTSDILQLELNTAEEHLLTEDWNQALVQIEDIEYKWSQYKSWWAIFLNHATLNNIEISISRLKQHILTENRSLSLAELHELLILLKDIPESEKLKLNNIL